ncbi:hypothetical protein R6Q59_004837, partial [Mikania micrantha]
MLVFKGNVVMELNTEETQGYGVFHIMLFGVIVLKFQSAITLVSDHRIYCPRNLVGQLRQTR